MFSFLPMPRSRRTLDFSVEIGRDPAAVKIARLRNDAQIADPRLVHQPGIECHVTCKGGKAGAGAVIGPSSAQGCFASAYDIEIARDALPFAKAGALSRAQRGVDILARQVIGGRVMCFQRPQGAGRLGH